MTRTTTPAALLALALALPACGEAPEKAAPVKQEPAEPLYQGATVTQWLSALRKPAQRRPAIIALSEALTKDERVVPALAALLRHDDPKTRNSASLELSKAGRFVVPEVAKILRDPSLVAGRAAADTLNDIGSDALQVGLRAAHDTPHAANAYARVAELAPRLLVRELDGGDDARKASIVAALAKAEAFPILVKALAIAGTRDAAMDALTQQGEVVVELLMGTRDDTEVWPHASEILERIENAKIMVEVRALAKDPTDRGAQVRLERYGAPAMDVLLACLTDDDAALRRAGSGGLVFIGEKAAAKVAKLLDGKLSPESRAVAADTLVKMERHGAAVTGEMMARGGEAFDALAEAGRRAGRDAVGFLLSLLASPDGTVRKAVAPLIVELGEPALVYLGKFALQKDPKGRQDVLDVLVQMGESGVQTLVDLLGAEARAVRLDARKACIRLGVVAVPGLLEAMTPGDPRAPEAERVLKKVGPAALPAIIAALPGAGPDGEQRLIDLLMGYGTPAGRALAQVVAGGDEVARAPAARALGHLGPAGKAHIAVLSKAAASKDVGLRAAAVTSLARLGGSRKDLAGALSDPSDEVRVAAAMGLLFQSPNDRQALGVLMKALESTDPTLRMRAVAGLAPGTGTAVEKALLAALEDKVPAVRLAAIGAWERRSGERQAPKALASLYDDPDPEVRRRAREAFDRVSEYPHAELVGFGGDARGSRYKRSTLKRNGGSNATVKAVESALMWLADNQAPDGTWDTGEYSQYRIGVSSLAMLAFQGNGYTHVHGAHKKVVERTLRYLLDRQDSEGCIGPMTTRIFQYNHAIATLALIDLYILTKDETLRAPAQKAVNFIHKSQNPYLAWRYGVRDGDNDTSVTVWMCMALRVAQDAGLKVDRSAMKGAVAWVDKMTEPEFGRAGYQRRGGQSQRYKGFHDRFPTDQAEAMTAAACLVRICAGAREDDEFLLKGADLLVKKLPRWDEDAGTIDQYYWLLATEVMFNVGGAHWKRWNAALKDQLLESQRPGKAGGRAGSWDPEGAWSTVVGRAFATTVNVLCLQTYYRRGAWLAANERR